MDQFSLKPIVKKYFFNEKIFIVPTHTSGQQIAQALVLGGDPWVNLKMVTVKDLALEVLQSIDPDNICTACISPIEHESLVSDIFNQLDGDGSFKYFKKLGSNIGIIAALSRSIKELRDHGIFAADIKEEHFISPEKAQDIRLILQEYEKQLLALGLTDSAGLLPSAIKVVKNLTPPESSKESSPQKIYLIDHRCYMTGLERQFIDNITQGRLIIVNDSPAFGVSLPNGGWSGEPQKIPEAEQDISRLPWLFDKDIKGKAFNDGTVSLFRSDCTRNEIREVMRRIIDGGTLIDTVEIIHTDSKTYDWEIYSACEKAGIPVTFAGGRPWHLQSSATTLVALLMWIKNDFEETRLRKMLLSSDMELSSFLKSPSASNGGADLAETLGMSGIGWSRQRYNILDQMLDGGNQGEDEFYRCNTEDVKCLRDLCGELFKMIPEPDKKDLISLSELCDGVIKFAQNYTIKRNEYDEQFIKNICEFLETLKECSSQSVLTEDAVDQILEIIRSTNVGHSNPLPGHLHVAYYREGGRSGRPNTFIVGLDEERIPGGKIQDPILLDEERSLIGNGLILADEVIGRNIYDMASLLSCLKGKLTVSAPSYHITEERGIFVSFIMLQIFRLISGNPEADYGEMLRELGKPVSFITVADHSGYGDETEWWLKNTRGGQDAEDISALVNKAYPWIKKGVQAQEKRESDLFTEYDGNIDVKDHSLDPRENLNTVLSASAVETAAKCPMQYFFKYVLGVEKPEETLKEDLTWLDALQRGSLLHSVYEEFANEIIKNPKAPVKDEMAFTILDKWVERYKEKIPPPSETVFSAEYETFKRDMGIFLTLFNEMGTKPEYTELKFGFDKSSPLKVPIGDDKSIAMHGMIDRIDRVGKNEYAVWDYKTGGSFSYEEEQYINKGKQLQHVLYSLVAREKLKEKSKGKKVSIKSSGYILPTEKGIKAGESGIYTRAFHEDKWKPALKNLLDIIGGGNFVLCDNGRLCELCDYVEICGDADMRKGAENKVKNDKNESLEALRKLHEYE